MQIQSPYAPRFNLVLLALIGLLIEPLAGPLFHASAGLAPRGKGRDVPQETTDKASQSKSEKDVIHPKQPAPKVTKPPRHRAPAPARTPPFTLEWHLLRCRADGLQEEVRPIIEFSLDAHMQLAVKVSQPGFIYVIEHTEGGDGGIIDQPQQIFPDPTIHDAQGFVEEEREIILPLSCATGKSGCCCTGRPDTAAGMKTLSVIFSKKPLLDIVSKGQFDRAYVQELKAQYDERVNQQDVEASPSPKSEGAGRFTYVVKDRNLQNQAFFIALIRFRKI